MAVSKELIKEKVATNPEWAKHAIVALFNYQTAMEQAAESTQDQNKVGFNACDAEILTSFAKQVLQGRNLTQRQLAVAFKKLPKYSNQLYRIAIGMVI
jgi:hypothetical protein